jgi:hypothetical protein
MLRAGGGVKLPVKEELRQSCCLSWGGDIDRGYWPHPKLWVMSLARYGDAPNPHRAKVSPPGKDRNEGRSNPPSKGGAIVAPSPRDGDHDNIDSGKIAMAVADRHPPLPLGWTRLHLVAILLQLLHLISMQLQFPNLIPGFPAMRCPGPVKKWQKIGKFGEILICKTIHHLPALTLGFLAGKENETKNNSRYCREAFLSSVEDNRNNSRN